MICLLVLLLFKRNVGILFGALRSPYNDAPPPFLACYSSVSLWCLVIFFLLLPQNTAKRIGFKMLTEWKKKRTGNLKILHTTVIKESSKTFEKSRKDWSRNWSTSGPTHWPLYDVIIIILFVSLYAAMCSSSNIYLYLVFDFMMCLFSM
jgi:hypothetical protein